MLSWMFYDICCYLAMTILVSVLGSLGYSLNSYIIILYMPSCRGDSLFLGLQEQDVFVKTQQLLKADPAVAQELIFPLLPNHKQTVARHPVVQTPDLEAQQAHSVEFPADYDLLMVDAHKQVSLGDVQGPGLGDFGREVLCLPAHLVEELPEYLLE